MLSSTSGEGCEAVVLHTALLFLVGPGDCADEPCDAFVVEETDKGFQCRVEVPSPLYK